ncbi:helix-turn-helix domain-containing protein [Jiella avicenniae]|uniref:Helix-turn-helix domain-containing protein n=1 Tax=Jiella avicenniae TaxID=2907202 RepID=A0A9X1TC54_9HYPH|nr:helix-turn-helix domain-containing protein [Jiella avicenniae]MCE7028723.1 helix-turn-helix domain-containing protein [Jiella avicenniae]
MNDPVDAHVGARLRHARLTAQLSQEELALALGVSAERVHQYECGAERVGAGRLYLACRRLNVSPTYFFEGYEGPAAGSAAGEDPSHEGDTPAPETEERASRLAVDRLIDQIMQRIRSERSGT